ncbi:hypothetical protein EVAR_66505_1 [Eumeta japonica]|uniref:Uncharacterized protein n=1 Tax=Eumeta variegata TaxID=151549 RepID=A0A4C1ZBG3_EUMVA|nr:hypothetical protein EVAR_66505_1 [Eumeta japonica]
MSKTTDKLMVAHPLFFFIQHMPAGRPVQNIQSKHPILHLLKSPSVSEDVATICHVQTKAVSNAISSTTRPAIRFIKIIIHYLSRGQAPILDQSALLHSSLGPLESASIEILYYSNYIVSAKGAALFLRSERSPPANARSTLLHYLNILIIVKYHRSARVH